MYLSGASGCWRGYVCEYKVLANEFILNKLQINLGGNILNGDAREFTSEQGPMINGVKPFLATASQDLFNNTYQELNLHMDFTGGMLAADDFIHELYIHMGFHPAWKYRNVFELIFSHGYVTEKRDVSGSCKRSGTEWLSLSWNQMQMPQSRKSKHGSLRHSSSTTICKNNLIQ
jgi:hypothetical protein